MKTLYFNRQSLKGSLSTSNHSDISIQVNDDIQLSKTIQEYDKDIQKINEENQPIYLQNVYEEIIKENILGYEKVTEVTDSPCIESVWKTNQEGFKLYYQNVYDENHEYIIEVIEVTNHMQIFSYREEIYYETTDEIISKDELGNNLYKVIPQSYQVPDKFEYNRPIFIDKHIEDEDGNKLYLKPIKETWTEIEVTNQIETTEPIHVISYREETVIEQIKVMISECDHICGESCGDGCIHECGENCQAVFETQEVEKVIQVPDKIEENEPLMIPSYKDTTVNILSRPEEFDITEVLEVIYSEKMLKYNYSNIIVDMFINEEDIDFTYEEHSANTGAFVLTLLPMGKVKLKSIELETPASKFELLENNIHKDIDIYINNVKFVDGIAILPHPASKCTLRFENKSNKLLDIKSYSILYCTSV